MTDLVPVVAGAAPPGDQQVLLTAIAKAAAELAAHDVARRREVEPLSREEVKEIATACAEIVIAEVFSRFDVDLDDKESARGFREDLSHARRARRWWDKAGASLFAAIMTAVSGGLIAAVVKYLSVGGAK
jgi:hypothetical protein